MKGRVCLSDVKDFRRLIMEKAHCSTYVMHLGGTKMYQTIKENYWWSSIKRDIVEFLSRCLVCQQVKTKHRKPLGTLQLSLILEWKWEHITMDFVVSLPRTQASYDAIW